MSYGCYNNASVWFVLSCFSDLVFLTFSWRSLELDRPHAVGRVHGSMEYYYSEVEDLQIILSEELLGIVQVVNIIVHYSTDGTHKDCQSLSSTQFHTSGTLFLFLIWHSSHITSPWAQPFQNALAGRVIVAQFTECLEETGFKGSKKPDSFHYEEMTTCMMHKESFKTPAFWLPLRNYLSLELQKGQKSCSSGKRSGRSNICQACWSFDFKP